MYGKYFNSELVEEVLAKIHDTRTMLFKENFKNKEEGLRQYKYFNENMFEFMLSTAILIFQDHGVDNLAYDIIAAHTSKENIETMKNNMESFNCQINCLKKNNYKMRSLENPLMLNFIFCNFYMNEFGVSMIELEPLTLLLEKAQKHVENVITLAIQNRVKIEKNI